MKESLNRKLNLEHGAKKNQDMPREKMIRYGANCLSDDELLAILIRSGTKNLGVLELTRHMLEKSGGLDILADYSYEELCTFEGVGPSKATILLATMELAKRVHFRKNKNLVDIKTPSTIYDAYGHLVMEKKREEFWVLLLNTKHQVIGEEVISIGSLNQSIVHPREVFLTAIRRSAESILVFHNHPSGSIEPSQEDLVVTKRLVDAGNLIGIPLLDHLIIGKNGYFSFKENGII